MIAPLVLAALLAQAPADPCAPVKAAATRDPEGARAYLAVADEERAAGREEPAVMAYRAALQREPGLERARAALAQVCAARRAAAAAGRVEAAFTRGLERLRAGDCPGALPGLEEARTAGDTSAALLVGLCRFRQGEDEQAGQAFREAAAAPDTRAAAELYLGLLALRGGRPGEAAPLFRSATADPSLAPVARELARQARREGRVVVSLLAEGGWDSNVDLDPADGDGDGLAALTGLLSVSPWLERGPYLRGAASVQAQARRDEYDLIALGAAAGLPIGPPRRRLLLEYGYDDRRVGGEPYLSAHRVLADGRAALDDRWSGGAAYSLRGERYHGAAAADDSGLQHAAQLDVTAILDGYRLTVAGQAAWHGARTSSRAYRELGPLLALATPVTARLRGVVEVACTWRAYQARDDALEARRGDTYADAAGRLELDLTERWTTYVSVAARRAFSSVPDLRYARVVPGAGLSFTAGVP